MPRNRQTGPVIQESRQSVVDRPRGLHRALVPAVLFTVVVVLYLPSVGFDFIYDDHELILEQPVPGSWRDVAGVFRERHWYNLPYYRPVVRSTMLIQKYLHGDDPAPFHAFNVVLAGGMAVVTWGLLRAPVLGIPPLFAGIGAALVALHPIASCTVYPVCSGRETLLPVLLIVAAMGAYLRSGAWWRAAAMSLFAISLLCKEQAVIVPLLFVLADLTGLTDEGPPGTAVLVRRHAPIVVILVIYGLVRWWLFHGTHEHRIAIFDEPAGPLFSLLYAIQMVWAPFVDLVYEPPVSVWLSGWGLFCGGTVTVLLVSCVLRSPAARKVGFFWLGWVLMSLLPTANVLQQEAPFAERYLLLALPGVAGLLGTCASTRWDRPAFRQATIGGLSALLVVCGAISFHRGSFYRDDLSFHSQWVASNPKSDQAHRSLGWVLLEQGRLTEAREHLELAIQLNPEVAETYNNLGNLLVRTDQIPQAIALYRQALSLDPQYAQAHYNIAVALARTGELDAAAVHFQRAIQRPGYSEAHNGYGIVLQMQGQPAAAAVQFEQALRFNPYNAEAHNNLGNLLAEAGRYTEALEHFERAVEINPTYATARDSARQMRAQLRERR